MKLIRVTYLALGAFVFATSCSKEAAEPDVFTWDDGRIYFKPSISQVIGSRAKDMTLDRLESFQVTCFNTADKSNNPDGFISPYFENATFVRRLNSPVVTTYVSSPDEAPRDWPANSGFLRFFAFSPSLAKMGENASLEGTKTDYRLASMRINRDISLQADFVTAQASGERWADFTAGVELAFSHQLSQVELRAWGSGEQYDFEIAGVRLGNPVVEGSFVFADDADPQASTTWYNANEGMKDKVEYLYMSSESSNNQGQPYIGDIIYRINRTEHNTAQSAASIMGQGGCAMVIPTVNAKWEGTADPEIGQVPYSTTKMYFSILTRVTDSSSGSQIYPYPDDDSGMTVISYAVDASGRILTRLYAGQIAGSYFTDSECKHPYYAGEGEEIKDFGWAAVPVDVDWKAGKRYVYTLNYSEGIGLHVPEDPDPGKPIGGKTSISWGMTVANWDYAVKDENYNPDLEIPE